MYFQIRDNLRDQSIDSKYIYLYKELSDLVKKGTLYPQQQNETIFKTLIISLLLALLFSSRNNNRMVNTNFFNRIKRNDLHNARN